MGEVVQMPQEPHVWFEVVGPEGKPARIMFRNQAEFNRYLEGEKFDVEPFCGEPQEFWARPASAIASR